MINKAHIKIGDVIYGSSDSVDIIYDNTESGLESNNIQDAIDEIAAGVCFADGIVVNVEMANWIAQEDRTYTNTVAIEGILESEMYDISLYGESTEEQAYAYDFLVTDIDIYDGQIVLTASEEITVAFSVILRGKVNLENKNVYVSDLSATNIEYDNSESNMEATDMQNAIDELATSVKGIVVPVTTDSWDLQSDGTYKKVIAIEGLTGKEVLDTCLNPSVTHTEEQITAFSELVTSIETAKGRIILTASEAITVGFSILLYGKVSFEVSVVEGGNGTNGGGNTTSIDLTQAEYDALVESGEVIEDVNYYITDATNISNTGNTSSDVFVSTKDYVVGDYCIYGNSLYKFISDKPAGEWDESSVVVTSVGNEIKELNAIIDEQNKNLGFESGEMTLKGTDQCTVTNLHGNYIKFGKLVFFNVEFTISGNGDSTMYIDCLPYPTKSVNSFTVGYANAIFKDPVGNRVFTSLFAGTWNDNTTSIYIGGSLDGRTWTFEGSVCDTPGNVNINGLYEIAD